MPPCGGCHCRASRCSFLGCRSGETNETPRDFEFLVFSAHPFELEAKNLPAAEASFPSMAPPAGPSKYVPTAGPAIGKAFFAAPLSIPPKAFPAGDRIMLPAAREILLINLPRNWSSSCSSVTKQTLNFRTDRATASREIHWGDKRRFNSNRYPLTVLRRVAAPRPRCRRRREPSGRNPAYRRCLQASDSRGNETKPYLSP
jgi:hypothetical protein